MGKESCAKLTHNNFLPLPMTKANGGVEVRRAKDKRLLIAKGMPPLKRTHSDEKYSYKNDEVLKWIAERPGLLCYVFDKLSNGKYIEYDSTTGTWRGVDYDDT